MAYASGPDFEECRRLHRQFGSTYYFASRRFPAHIRRRVDALYGFVRVPDEWVDNPGSRSRAELRELLSNFREQLLNGLQGQRPEHPVLRAFCDVMHEMRMPVEEPMLFLDAMTDDLTIIRYPTYEALAGYMRGSAAAVGLMMCYVLETPSTPEVIKSATALGNAMQLTNFLRDVGEDLERGRVYLPQEDLARFEITDEDLLSGQVTPKFIRLMQFEIERARDLYAQSDFGIPLLPPMAQKPVKMARILYARILNKVEQRNYDVFAGRARTTRLEKLQVAAQVLLNQA